MEIREAILRAADHIERFPEDFDFDSMRPGGCGTPACVLGWIHHFAGIKFDVGNRWYCAPPRAAEFIGTDENEFYQEMTALRKQLKVQAPWQDDAIPAATLMRAYADRHHPAVPKTEHAVPNKGIPDNVLSIFREDIAA